MRVREGRACARARATAGGEGGRASEHPRACRRDGLHACARSRARTTELRRWARVG